MKNIFISLAAIFGLWALAACSSDLSEEIDFGSIAGSVSDATTGEPVATVNVTITPGGNSTVTGSDGSFSFLNLEAGEYTLQISKEGYKSNSKQFYVKTGDPTQAHMLIERIPGIVTADRETLDFGDNQSLNTLSFNIVNSSYEDLSWEIEHRCEWISEVKPDKGTLAYGKTEGIVIVIDRNKLNEGENKAVIVIRSSQGSSQMNVVAVGEARKLPTLNVLATTDVASSTATFNGEIVDNGIPAFTERGFVYSLTSKPTLENTIAKLTCPISSAKKFSQKVAELSHGKTYYVRAYAKNSVGVAYSANEEKFSTTIPMPKVSTLGVVDVDFSAGTATFRGEVTFAGDPPYTERGFVYGTQPEPTVNDNKVVANGSGEVGKYSKYMTGLPKKSYYVRAYASAPTGIVYGEEITVSPEIIEIPSAGIAVQKEDLGSGNWETAKTMCESSTLGGYTDWRLPTKVELMVLYNNRNTIGGFTDSKYWSSSLYYNNGYYYSIDFSNGYLSDQIYYKSFNVRAVRTLTD